jgi:hypothetical protein
VVRDEADDPFAIAGRQPLPGIDKSNCQPIDPEPTVGVEHHLDDFSIFQPQRDRRTQCCPQHARATRRRLVIEMMDCHFRPRLSAVNTTGNLGDD